MRSVIVLLNEYEWMNEWMNESKLLAAAASPHTPLGELTALPQSPSLEGVGLAALPKTPPGFFLVCSCAQIVQL